MTELSIWDRLAMIDPALTEQQRCEHGVWVLISNEGSNLEYRCSKCGYIDFHSLAGQVDWCRDPNEHPAVGDGRNKEKYNSTDALIRLARNLNIELDIRTSKNEFGVPFCTAVAQGSFGVAVMRGSKDPEVIAEAILKAYPTRVCEIPEGGKEVPDDGR